MSAPGDVQQSTLQTFIEGWKAWTPEGMTCAMSTDCTQQAMPFALGVPQRSKAEIDAVLPKLMSTVTNYELTIHEIVHDARRSKAAIYAISRGDTPFGDWNMEYAVFITFSECGKLVTKVEEMMDSAFMKEFGPKFQKYLSENCDS